jgi:hypothetical protein
VPAAGDPLAIEEQLIYRDEVLTIMGVLGDVRAELETIRRTLRDEDDEEEEDA